jgi:hypothetical protein
MNFVFCCKQLELHFAYVFIVNIWCCTLLLHFNFGVYYKYFDALCFVLSSFLQLHSGLNCCSQLL